MAESKTNQNTEGDLIDVLGKLMIMMGVIALFNGKILIRGAKEIKEPINWIFTIMGGVLVASVFVLLRLERSLLMAMGLQEYIPHRVAETFQVLGVLAVTFTGLILWALGIKPFFTHLKYQRAIDSIGLKDAKGSTLKLIEVKSSDEFTKSIKLLASGIGEEKVLSKKSEIESAFGENIENIQKMQNPKFVEIRLTTKTLPTKINFEDFSTESLKPATLVIGESKKGMITKDITDLPHLLIAGTTGGGKSQFFKQSLLCLLKSTDFLKLYLIDLKGGLEFKNFSKLPNGEVSKEISSAVTFLREVKKEMSKRFDYLESKGLEKINPKRHSFNRIVIGVDEASVLFSKPSRDSYDYNEILEARHLTEEIAKLGRAAAIHLILATQKVSKESIDTRVQENILGRMCFKTGTPEGSVRVLGNVKASRLPSTPGRGIWQCGHEETEVQAPFLSKKVLNQELNQILSEFLSGEKKIHQEQVSKQKRSLPVIGKNKLDGVMKKSYG